MNIYRISNQPRLLRSVFAGRLSVIVAALVVLAPAVAFANQTENSVSAKIIATKVQVDKRVIQVAEKFQLEITATAPRGVSVRFPDLEHQLGNFEVLAVKDTWDIPDGPKRKWIRRVGLESLVSGELEIPGIEISYVDRRGSTPRTGLQKTASQNMTVRSALEGTEDPTRFRDIKSVVFLPETQSKSHWLTWAAGAAGFLVVGTTVLALARRKKTFSPKQHAIKSLCDLKASSATEDRDAEQVYVRLVSILRSFVQEQYGISAPRLTTGEFLVAMRAENRLSESFRFELAELLSLADMIKFARMLPVGTELTEVVDQALILVENVPDAEQPKAKHGDAPTTEEK